MVKAGEIRRPRSRYRQTTPQMRTAANDSTTSGWTSVRLDTRSHRLSSISMRNEAPLTTTERVRENPRERP